MEIVQLDAAAVERHVDELAQLLLDAHASNMALGLAAPLTRARAADEWRRLAAALAPGSRLLLAALDDDVLVGAVHVARAHAENGTHRAEIQRLVVRTDRRRGGTGAALLDPAADRPRPARIAVASLSPPAAP